MSTSDKRSAPRQLVFVYGTLKRGGSNHAFMSGQIFCGEARTVAGFSLISLGEFPGIVPDPDDREGVAGEVWSVDQPCLAELDELEGIAEGLYRRERVTLQPPFAECEVSTYFYAQSTIGRSRLSGGIWTEPRKY